MKMKIKCGNCPICGAPIYSYTPWNGNNPPPTYRTCNCLKKSKPQHFNELTSGLKIMHIDSNKVFPVIDDN
jgi:hypothetical protein